MMSEKQSGELGQFKVSRVLMLSAALVILLVLLLFYFRQDPQATQAALSDTGVAQPTPSSVQPAQDAAQKDPQSLEPARKVLIGLRRLQDATEGNLTYEEYDERLTRLKADLNSTLPTFVRHDPSDESFRQEVAAALRDYTAAQSWWKTIIRNSQVLTDADRTARLKVEWGSAQTHLDNAEKLLRPENRP
jgi:hypothetical protein